MSKRSLPPSTSRRQKTEPLGALEFAAALNGDDARVILSALKRFNKTVRQEQRSALFPRDDDDSFDEDSETDDNQDEHLQVETNKRSKHQEEWMKDTNEYNVPFVATSVAKGKTGTVVSGEWPTGLLQAYLEVSPVAAELTGDSLIPPSGYIHKTLLRAKQGKMSHAIYKAYLEALSLVLSAAVSKEVLRRNLGVTNSAPEAKEDNTDVPLNQKLVSIVMKDRLTGLLSLIGAETGNGKGKPACPGGCGPLAGPALQILVNLAASSVGTGREVARAMDASLREGVLRVLFRRPAIGKGEDATAKEADATAGSKQEARIASLRLACILLEYQNPMLLTYIVTAGSKERKIQPGILYVALRRGLDDPQTYDEDNYGSHEYWNTISRLMIDLQLLMPNGEKPNSDTRKSERSLLSRRDLGDLFQGDALVNMCRIANGASHLTVSYETVLDGSDSDESVEERSAVAGAGVQSQRLLFPLLVDPAQSPFLGRISHSDDKQSSSYGQQLVRILISLLDNGSISIQKFVIRCLSVTPALFASFFRMLSVPDSSSTFAFIARLGFLARVVHEGPSMAECLNFVEGNQKRQVDQILQCLIPANLKKHTLSKALQSSSALLVSETLKIIVLLLQRFEELTKSSLYEKNTFSDEMKETFSDAAVRRLPDLQALVAIRSRFDPFSADASRRANAIVNSHVCRVLESYASLCTRTLTIVNFDWMRLLPDDAHSFSRASPSFQLRLLKTLQTIIPIEQGREEKRASLETMLEVMITTRVHAVYSTARSLLLRMLQNRFVQGGPESKKCMEFEISCFIDGLSSGCLSEFCQLVDEASTSSFQHKITLAEAWNQTHFEFPLSSVSTSPLLVSALRGLRQQSNQLALLSCQVASKCLLYQHFPLPLAALIENCISEKCESEDAGDKNASNSTAELSRYARLLLSFDEHTPKARLNALTSMISVMFSRSYFVAIFTRKMLVSQDSNLLTSEMHNFSFESMDHVTALRQCLHVYALVSGDQSFERPCLSALRPLIPLVAKDDSEIWRQHPLVTKGLIPFEEVVYVNLVFLGDLSCNVNSPCGLVQSRLELLCEKLEGENNGPDFTQDTRKTIFYVSLLKSLHRDLQTSRLVEQLLSSSCQEVEEKSADFISLPVLFACFWLEESLILPAEASLKAWKTICLYGDLRHTATRRLLLLLEAHFGNILTQEADHVQSSSLYSVMLNTPAVEIISLCLRSKAATLELGKETGINIPTDGNNIESDFLTCLLKIDISRFGPSFLESLASIKRRSEIMSLLKDGYLDQALQLTSVNHALRQSDEFASALVYIVDRFVDASVVFTHGSDQARNSAVNGIRHLSEALWHASSGLKPIHLDKIVEALSSVLSSGLGDTTLTPFYILTKKFLSLSGYTKLTDLGSLVLVRLFQDLHRQLKHHFRSTNSQNNLTKDQVLPPNEIEIMITELFDEVDKFNGEFVEGKGLAFINGSLRACLKYGIANFSDDTPAISESCLRFVRVVLSKVANPESGLNNLVHQCNFLNPTKLFAMIVSHSCFNSAIISAVQQMRQMRSAAKDARLELVRLLLCSVSLARGEISFSREVWTALLSGYNGGTTETDIILRRLLFLGASTDLDKKMDNKDIPFLDEFRFSSFVGDSTDTHENESSGRPGKDRWDWFVNGIDLGRVRCTLCQFPLRDRLHPDPIATVEVLVSKDGDAIMDSGTEEEVDESMSIDSSVDSGIDSSGDSGSDNEEKAYTNFSDSMSSACDDWSSEGPDIRYSPAFVLPLILGALESNFPRHETGESTVTTNGNDGFRALDDVDKKLENFARVAQRLCDKGALSLVLASLCSKCPSVRQVAVVSLRFFMVALESKQAREMTTWRERPQLAMILNAVQRGLTIGRAAQLSRLKEYLTAKELSVPMLPSLPSIFLARAALIVTKPGDPMYGPINRHFLKVEHDHGAFQDMNRLPAFIALFCSSADDPGQARKERMWALQLLKDGFVDEASYRLVSSCHAPELLLTSFNGLVARSKEEDPDQERILLLRTVARLLRRGGQRTATHLIGRMGLLSWLRVQLCSSPSPDVLPFLESRIAFVDLVSIAAKQAHFVSRMKCGNGARMEKTSLLSAILALYHDTVKQGLLHAKKHDKETDITASFAETMCDAICNLNTTDDKTLNTTDDNDVKPYGLLLLDVCQFLSELPDQSKQRVIAVFCTVPILFEPSCSEAGAQFCVAALSILMQLDAIEATAAAILNRVNLIMQLHRDLISSESKEYILQSLLACRRKCVTSSRTHEAWFGCLDSATKLTDNGVVSNPAIAKIATDILHARMTQQQS